MKYFDMACVFVVRLVGAVGALVGASTLLFIVYDAVVHHPWRGVGAVLVVMIIRGLLLLAPEERQEGGKLSR